MLPSKSTGTRKLSTSSVSPGSRLQDGCTARMSCTMASNEKAEKSTHPTRLVPKTRFNRKAYGGIRQGKSRRMMLYTGGRVIIYLEFCRARLCRPQHSE